MKKKLVYLMFPDITI